MLGLAYIIAMSSAVAIIGMAMVWWGSQLLGWGLSRRPITTIVLCVAAVLVLLSIGHQAGFDLCDTTYGC